MVVVGDVAVNGRIGNEWGNWVWVSRLCIENNLGKIS